MMLFTGLTAQLSTDSTTKCQGIADAANNFLGCPYKLGAAGESKPMEFDCSGLVMFLFKQNLGIELPHSALEQSKLGESVDEANLKPGDLLFFDTENAGRITHVGIYEGNNKFIAANTGQQNMVSLCYLDSAYWSPLFRCARRITAQPPNS